MSSDTTYWRLDGTDTTLLVVQDHAVPRLYWCGDKLQDNVLLSQLLAHDDSALAFGGLDNVTPLSLFPQASTGYAGSPALNGHRNGAAFAHSMHTASVTQADNSLTITLVDDHAGLTAEIWLSLDVDSDVARMTTTLTNSAATPYTVDWLASATLPMPNHYRECLTQHGRWGLENQSHRRNIAPGRIDISNLHGRTSHEHAPSLACGTAGFGTGGGDVMFAHFGWSGNFSLRVERLENSEISLPAGVLFLPGECILKPGEQLATPTVTFTRGNGMNQRTQRFHHHIRTNILPDWNAQGTAHSCHKWDMNRDLVLAGDGSHVRSAAQPTALYRLLERIF